MVLGAVTPIPRGTSLVERFVIRRVLGRGGMATVYEAEDVRLRQRVAVKVLAPVFAADAGAVERFLREARAVVRLRNQHVVRVIDAGTLDHGAPYLVMEYLDGQSLAELLSTSGRAAAHDVVDYALQALEALAEAHRAGIVHRDLKPDNLMLVRSEDDRPQIKVIDFGISKLLGPEFTIRNLTLESSFLGSPLYASPEQLRDTGKVDARTDIWSLGVVMYELLTGRPPFEARSPAAAMAAICAANPINADDLESCVAAPLANVVMRCLEKDPDDRYASARELAQALAPFAEDARSRLSVERIARVQSSAPPPPPALAMPIALEEQTTPSMPPAWSTVTEAPRAGQVESQTARRRHMRWALGLAALGGLCASLVAYEHVSSTVANVRVGARSMDSPPAASLAQPAESIGIVARDAALRPVASSSQLAARAAPSVQRSASAGAVPGATGESLKRAQLPAKPPEVRSMPVASSKGRALSPARSGQPIGVATRARPLDQANPFAR